MRHFLYISLILLVFMESCAYRWHVVKDYTHKKHYKKRLVKHTKDKSCIEAERQANIFVWRYEFKEQPNNTWHISTDTSQNTPFVQFDTNRVYLFEGSEKFADLLTSGVLTDKMLYCAMDSLCLMNPIFDTSRYYNDSFMIAIERKNYLKHFDRDIYGWRGNCLGIFHIEQFYGFHPSRTNRRFELWVSNMRWSGGDGYDVLYMEITNKSGRRHVSLKTFLKDAHVTFLKRVYIMI